MYPFYTRCPEIRTYKVSQNIGQKKCPRIQDKKRCPRIQDKKRCPEYRTEKVSQNIGQKRCPRIQDRTECPKQDEYKMSNIGRYWVSQNIGRMLNKHSRQFVQPRISTKAIMKDRLTWQLSISRQARLATIEISQAHLATNSEIGSLGNYLLR